MPNDWFQFRQFLIRQDQTAMKVGTDGVLLGAWAECETCKNVLDVGTGTGLIALMIAQRAPSSIITALEIDPSAVQQAKENVAASSWKDRIDVLEANFLDWQPDNQTGFDLIVCNPPFFTQSLKNPDLKRTMARHDHDLPLGQLVAKSSGLLSKDGKLAMILPAGRLEESIALASASGLFLYRQLNIRGNPDAPIKRVMIELSKESRKAEIAELVIETGSRGVYSEGYRKLTVAFYL